MALHGYGMELKVSGSPRLCSAVQDIVVFETNLIHPLLTSSQTAAVIIAYNCYSVRTWQP